MTCTNGTIDIVDSLFIGNELKAVEETEYFSGGGGIYIEFTNCTPGVVTYVIVNIICIT